MPFYLMLFDYADSEFLTGKKGSKKAVLRFNATRYRTVIKLAETFRNTFPPFVPPIETGYHTEMRYIVPESCWPLPPLAPYIGEEATWLTSFFTSLTRFMCISSS